jgi:hypothetical protein
MYNLTNNQKNLAKWLVKNVRDGSLDEEFSLHVIRPLDSISHKVMFESYRGTAEEQTSIVFLAKRNPFPFKCAQMSF